MSTMINANIEDSLYNKIEKKGTLLHTIEVTNQSKGAWSEVYLHEGDLYNVIYTDTQNAYLACIEKLDDVNELSKYISTDIVEQIVKEHNL